MMLVVDTNVISELMKVEPHPQVIAWFDSQTTGSVWTTCVSVFEIRFGLNSLPDVKRKMVLQYALTRSKLCLQKNWSAMYWTSTARPQWVLVKFLRRCTVSVVLWKSAMCKKPESSPFATRSWQVAISSTSKLLVNHSSIRGATYPRSAAG